MSAALEIIKLAPREWAVIGNGRRESFRTKRQAVDRLARIKAACARIQAERGQA